MATVSNAWNTTRRGAGTAPRGHISRPGRAWRASALSEVGGRAGLVGLLEGAAFVVGERDLERGYRVGDDGDEPVGRVRHDLADVVLRVVPAVRAAVEPGDDECAVRPGDVRADLGLPTPGTDLGQARVLPDLDAPPLVLGEVEVQAVDPVRGRDYLGKRRPFGP